MLMLGMGASALVTTTDVLDSTPKKLVTASLNSKVEPPFRELISTTVSVPLASSSAVCTA